VSEARILAYGEDLEAEIAGLAALLGRDGSEGVPVGARWVAIALLEGDREVECRWGDPGGDGRVGAAVAAARRRLAERGVDDVELAVVAARYGWANEVARATVATDGRRELRDRVDGLLLSRGIGIPLFLLGMYLVFSVTTGVSGAFLDWIDATMGGPVTHLARALLGAVGLGGTWVEGLVVDGVLVGVGTVLAFLPVLLSLYVALGILEDSGYMARAAFVMDRAMRAVGLPGKSFLPLLVGFGCNVPGVYATRTIDGERSRLRTGLLVPFMSCGARLPVYVLVAAALFPRRGGLVVLAMYLLGLLVALGIGALLRHVVPSRDADAVVVLELRRTGSPRCGPCGAPRGTAPAPSCGTPGRSSWRRPSSCGSSWRSRATGAPSGRRSRTTRRSACWPAAWRRSCGRWGSVRRRRRVRSCRASSPRRSSCRPSPRPTASGRDPSTTAARRGGSSWTRCGGSVAP